MLYKRRRKDRTLGKTWWTRFTINGNETRVSCGTDRKALAEEFERRLRDQIWRELELGDVIHTWSEAKQQWLIDKANKRSLGRDKEAFAALAALRDDDGTVLPDEIALADIDESIIHRCEAALGMDRKPRTVQRIIAPLRGVLRRAVKKWKWLAKAPEFEAPPKTDDEPRWVTKEQFDALWRELPPHAMQIVRFAVAVGPRSGNIFRLRWANVDIQAGVFRVGAGDFKGKQSVGFPLPPEAILVLEQQRGAHPEYVFTDQRGRAPIGSIKTCWRKACRRAGLPGLRVHDLRHTFAAWHKLSGTPDHALQSLGGWKDERMVKKYGHINPQDYAHFADNRRTDDGTSVQPKRRKSGEN